MTTPTFTCNGCGQATRPSKEHLIHLAIGRVLFRNKQLNTDQLRERLNKGWFPEYREYVDPLDSDAAERPMRLDWWVRNFLCANCNGTWAKTLEEKAGRQLYSFIHGDGPASDPLMREWAWFFALKLWRYYRRNEALNEGLLYPFLRHIAAGNAQEVPPIFLCRMRGRNEASDKRWRFAFLQGPNPRYWCFVMWSVVFFAVLPRQDGSIPALPVTVTPLANGMRKKQVPIVDRRELSVFDQRSGLGSPAESCRGVRALITKVASYRITPSPQRAPVPLPRCRPPTTLPAGRVAERTKATVCGTRERDLRVHRDLPQPQATTQR